ncbi:hypothetical protein MRX96_056422 [Rhipicephalus microplus]
MKHLVDTKCKMDIVYTVIDRMGKQALRHVWVFPSAKPVHRDLPRVDTTTLQPARSHVPVLAAIVEDTWGTPPREKRIDIREGLSRLYIHSRHSAFLSHTSSTVPFLRSSPHPLRLPAAPPAGAFRWLPICRLQ